MRDRWKGFAELPDEVERSLRDLDELFARSGVQLAYLFGSLGRGESSHDVDLALLGGPTPVFELRRAIAERLGTQRLDLVDLADAPPLLRFEIVQTGHPIFVANNDVLNNFELATMHLYRDTQPLRKSQGRYLRERVAE
jgi:predicted nucleotidyltransferase